VAQDSDPAISSPYAPAPRPPEVPAGNRLSVAGSRRAALVLGQPPWEEVAHLGLGSRLRGRVDLARAWPVAGPGHGAVVEGGRRGCPLGHLRALLGDFSTLA